MVLKIFSIFFSEGELISTMLNRLKNLGLIALYPLPGGNRAPQILKLIYYLLSKFPPLSYMYPLSIKNLSNSIGS